MKKITNYFKKVGLKKAPKKKNSKITPLLVNEEMEKDFEKLAERVGKVQRKYGDTPEGRFAVSRAISGNLIITMDRLYGKSAKDASIELTHQLLAFEKTEGGTISLADAQLKECNKNEKEEKSKEKMSYFG